MSGRAMLDAASEGGEAWRGPGYRQGPSLTPPLLVLVDMSSCYGWGAKLSNENIHTLQGRT